MSKVPALSKARRTVAGILVGAATVTGAVTTGFVVASTTQTSASSDSDSTTTSTSGSSGSTSTVTSSNGSSQTTTHGS